MNESDFMEVLPVGAELFHDESNGRFSQFCDTRPETQM